jgi:hypothetical protein
MMEFTTDNVMTVGHVSAPLLVVAVQLIVIGTILAAQLYVLMTAGRYLHTAPWVSALWAGLPHTLCHAHVLYNLASVQSDACQDVYIFTLVGSVWIITMLALPNRKDFLSVRNILTLCWMVLSAVCLLLKYHYRKITEETPSRAGLFCRPAQVMLPIFAQEYLTLYIPLLALGIIPRCFQSNGMDLHKPYITIYV